MADPRPRPPASRSIEIDRLRRQLEQVRNGWGDRAALPPEAERMERLIADKRIAAAAMRYRLEAAASALGDLRRQQAALESEIGGYEMGLEALLRERLEEAEGWAAPMWSPIPVFGYRLWWATSDGLQGATRFVWNEPHLSATCGGLGGDDDGEVPHTDGRCGRPPCGIYALKDPGPMVRFGASTAHERLGVVVGLTALSGKVVEHTDGYRSAHAEVTAAVVLQGDHVLWGDSPNWIDHLFRDPAAATAAIEIDRTPGPGNYLQAIDYLTERQHREEQRWTSVSRSE